MRLGFLALVSLLGVMGAARGGQAERAVHRRGRPSARNSGATVPPRRRRASTALARRGLRVRDGHSASRRCATRRGRRSSAGGRPDSLHLWSNNIHFREKNADVTTLPQWFKENGYETRCVGKIFHNWHTKEKGDRRSWSADEFLYYANHGDDVPEVKGPLPQSFALDIGRNYGKVPTVRAPRRAGRSLLRRPDFGGSGEDARRGEGQAVLPGGRILEAARPFNAPKKYWDMYDPKKLPPLLVTKRPKGALGRRVPRQSAKSSAPRRSRSRRTPTR